MHSFRFIHAADIHLDSPLRGLAGHDGTVAETIRGATRHALQNLVSYAIEEKVSFVIIAGDVYDGDWRDYKTGLFFAREMSRLNDHDIAVYIVRGNHDAQSQITRRLTLPPNVTVFSAKQPETYRVHGVAAALHGQSFIKRDVTDNLSLSYPYPTPGCLNIGVLHTALSGTEGHDNYAPCSLEDLQTKGYDYWALGHIHQYSVHHEYPHVIYSGIIQGRHINERGPKGAVIVTVESGAITDIAPFSTDVVRWAALKINARKLETLLDLEDEIRKVVGEAEEKYSRGRFLACRIIVEGNTSIHEAALADKERLTAEARAAAINLASDQIWIEKLVVATNPLRKRLSGQGIGDPLEFLDHAHVDEELHAELKQTFSKIVKSLPPDILQDPDDLILQSVLNKDPSQLIDLTNPLVPLGIFN